jgi:hypothetical protein
VLVGEHSGYSLWPGKIGASGWPQHRQVGWGMTKPPDGVGPGDASMARTEMRSGPWVQREREPCARRKREASCRVQSKLANCHPPDLGFAR